MTQSVPPADRKAQIAAWKERRVTAGVYALRCPAADGLWIGRAPDISTIERRIRFTLRSSGSAQRDLQAAFTAHGDEALSFEVLERLEPDADGPVPDYLLRSRHESWLARLGGKRI
ncbi:MAG: hypothetical protein DI568_09005 [Sphingomonas sp.]|nr:MAG: hypothetical protein DI568_09005 [Sphingomonas sp.]